MSRSKFKSMKKRLSFTFFKRHKWVTVLLIILGLGLFLTFGVKFARYSYNIIRTYYLRTQNFYFNSNRLTLTGKTYSIYPWAGNAKYKNSQSIVIEMNSKDNDLKYASADIVYEVTVTCDNSNVECYIISSDDDVDDENGVSDKKSKQSYTIEANGTNTSSFTVIVEAISSGNGEVTSNLRDGDVINVDVVASAISPYTQTLKGTFVITVGNYGVSYSISNNASYIDSLITNSLGEDVYVGLEFADSMDKVSFDMSNTIYNSSCTKASSMDDDDTSECVYNVTEIDGYEYISSIYFKVNSKSSALARFYKLNYTDNGKTVEASSIDYTYPNYNSSGNSKEPVVEFCKLDVTSLDKTVSCSSE